MIKEIQVSHFAFSIVLANHSHKYDDKNLNSTLNLKFYIYTDNIEWFFFYLMFFCLHVVVLYKYQQTVSAKHVTTTNTHWLSPSQDSWVIRSRTPFLLESVIQYKLNLRREVNTSPITQWWVDRWVVLLHAMQVPGVSAKTVGGQSKSNVWDRTVML